jgi:succinate-semialdehyde dehydrogenase / glutarate-semialdehyde dehydrogenase
MSYPQIAMSISGIWRGASDGASLPVVNPATEEVIGQVPLATEADLAEAAEATRLGFLHWRDVPAFERYKIMRRAADLVRERAESIVRIMTTEQGKPLAEARVETLACADIIDWLAEEARRNYGRIIPARIAGVEQVVIREPVGPVAAFTPWNFPLNQSVRKIGAALAAGCSIVIKAPEETPASVMELVRAFADAGVPAGVVNLVFGKPAFVSDYLIRHEAIRKISFTGSTAVGKQLAALAGAHMKRSTMELGGHAPAIVFNDADLDEAIRLLSFNKYRNAGQVCVSPTRFLIHEDVYEPFVAGFVKAAKAIKVGNGMDLDTKMGPLAHDRRITAMQDFVADARSKGASILTGGERIGNTGYFFQPTVIADVPPEARILNEEPFGPLAPMMRFSSTDDLIAEANRLPYGLAAYAFTRSAETRRLLASRVECGMITINHLGLALTETPFGGIKESGHGSEGGAEALDAYVTPKFVTQMI